MHKSRTPLTLALVAALAATTTVAANPLDVLQSPTWDEVAYDELTNTVTLSWNAPSEDDATPYSYRVYRNGALVETTTTTSYADLPPATYNTYWIVAEKSGQESLPSMPLIIESHQNQNYDAQWGLLFGSGGNVAMDTTFNDGCEPIINDIDLNNFPYLFFYIRWECIPIIGPGLDLPPTMDGPWRR